MAYRYTATNLTTNQVRRSNDWRRIQIAAAALLDNGADVEGQVVDVYDSLFAVSWDVRAVGPLASVQWMKVSDDGIAPEPPDWD